MNASLKNPVGCRLSTWIISLRFGIILGAGMMSALSLAQAQDYALPDWHQRDGAEYRQYLRDQHHVREQQPRKHSDIQRLLNEPE